MYKSFLLIVLGLLVASALFYYGIQIPLAYRLRGDAFDYLNIAQHFKSFTEAFNYIGHRAPGFPWFDYLFLSKAAPTSLLTVTNYVCFTLFLLHECTSLAFCFICAKLKLFTTQSIYFGLLFFLLAAYPAFVLYTTIPLSDVLGVDLLLIAFSLFAWGQNKATARSLYGCIFLSALSGCLLGYSILVRPAYLPGISGFMLIFIVLNLLRLNLRSLLISSVTILFLMTILFPVLKHCYASYHSVCLQSPFSVPMLESVRAGFRGAQTMWHYSSNYFPIYPEPFFVHHFAERCPITTYIGGSGAPNSSVLGCFFHAPILSFIFFVKKMIGLFNVFRMTPYTELLTPMWYIWLSQLFSAFAFLGFWILLISGLRRWNRKTIPSLAAAIWAFCLIQACMHSLLHVEERYIFPLIPFCLLAALLKIKQICEEDYSVIARKRWLILSFLILGLYYAQVLTWDSGSVVKFQQWKRSY